jgi:hypothetical protein
MFEQEFLAAFTDAGSSFLPMREVMLEPGPAHPEDAKSWIVGIDVAFAQDTFAACAVGESLHEPGVLLVGAVVGIAPGAKRKSLTARRRREDQTLAAVLRGIEPYHPTRIISDQYMANEVRSFFSREGIPVTIATTTGRSQTASFVSLRARLADGTLRLWHEPRLISELSAVRTRDTSDSIYLPRVGGDSHCDRAVALATAVFHLRGVTGVPEGRVVGGESMWKRARLRSGYEPDQRRDQVGVIPRRPLSMKDLDKAF